MLNVSAAIPLAILEAVRHVDRVSDSHLEDSELSAKRFGSSRTVTDQISRYEGLRSQGKNVGLEELEGLLRLVCRRLDSDLVLRIASEKAAESAAGSRGPAGSGVAGLLPGRLGKSAKKRSAASILGKLIDATIVFDTEGLKISTASADLNSEIQQAKCRFDGSLIGEVLYRVLGFNDALQHVSCRANGGEECVWRPIVR